MGFSHFLSLGDSADVDFGDLLDYLGSDPDTSAVLLYIESVTQARKFMSAARAAARNKPVLAIKAGRVAEGARAAASHTGALAGSDEVYDAAIRRAGMLRVESIEDLFDAVETLARVQRIDGERLVLLTNSGGPGVMATDALVRAGGRLATLAPETLAALDAVLPRNWSRANPVDIIGDAPASRYTQALSLLLADPACDAALILHAPVAVVSSAAVAEAIVPLARDARCPVLTCWLGEDGVREARRIFSAAGLATYDSPEDAVRAFMHLVDYQRNQNMLTETPPSPPPAQHDSGRARELLHGVLAAGRELLTEPEAKAVLGAYALPVVETRVAATPDEAARAAAELAVPVALKILSDDLSHKSDVGGVALELAGAGEVRDAANDMLARVRRLRPEASIDGFTVQAMVRWPGAWELIVGATVDPVFGPVLLFGQGGTGVEVIGDRALALPPLNLALARSLVSRTRVARLLAGYRGRAAADLEALYLSLVRVSQMLADLPEIVELDINPLLAGPHGVIALDARMRVAPAPSPGTERFAIRPYPGELEETVDFHGARLCLRPIRPEDEPAHRAFFSALQPQDVRFRFFGIVKALSHSQIARYTQIDYDREMAFVATIDGDDGVQTLGVARAIADPDNERAEFAILVRSDVKGRGLGALLMNKLVGYFRSRGTRALIGEVLEGNARMLALAREVGFRVGPARGGVHSVTLELR